MPHMKLLFDLFPVILFFVTFKQAEKSPELAAGWLTGLLGGGAIDPHQAPILLATLVVIGATVAQIAWVRLRHGKVDKMLWISLGLVSVFGGMTLIFHDETFIKWKPTILYWVFAASMLFSEWVLKKNPVRAMLGEQIELPATLWRRLTWAWIGFFTGMGLLNLYVAYHFSTDTWVNFKLFGGMGLLFAFVLAQGFVLSKYIEDKS